MLRFRLAVAVLFAGALTGGQMPGLALGEPVRARAQTLAQTPAQTQPPAQTQAVAQPATGIVKPLPPAGLSPAELERKIDELVRGHAAVNHFSGAVMIAAQGKPIVSKGYGLANREWQIPVAATTKFRIGSMTKAFTSMLIMQLREQGKVKLEDSVCVYVARCPVTWRPVTIHHLLTHTSGIPTYTGLPAWRAKNMVPLGAEQVIDYVRDLPLQWKPGEKYAYNNSGYFLLGMVVEKASGKTYEQALQEQILTPLGMKDTGYDWSRTVIPNRAAGYSLRAGVVENAAALDMQQPYAAGAMYSTVEDLLKWDQALYGDTLLPAAARKIMFTPFLSGYAYGWNIGAPAANLFGGHPRIAHSGGINGFASVIIRLPDVNVTITVLANIDSAPSPAIGRDIAAIYFGQPYQVPTPAK